MNKIVDLPKKIVWIIQNNYLKWLRTLLGIFVITSISWVILYTFVNPPFTPLMVIRAGAHIFRFEDPRWDSKRVWLEDISSSMIYATIAGEDQKFLDHFGFDIDAIQKALEYNITNRQIAFGGSTITQQTAKNVFLWPSKSIIRKGLETWFTFLIELAWSKQRILEVYLNIAEFGDGIYGIQSASQYYFGKTAKNLTNTEATLLVAILPNPRYYQDNLKSRALQKRKSAISRDLNKIKYDKDNKEFVKEIKQ